MMTAAAEWISAVFLGIGVLFIVLGALALLRLPDMYMRLQAASKPATMGVALIYIAVAVHFGGPAISRSLAAILFAFLTVPAAAHALALAAHRAGVRQWRHTQFDEYRSHLSQGQSSLAPGYQNLTAADKTAQG